MLPPFPLSRRRALVWAGTAAGGLAAGLALRPLFGGDAPPGGEITLGTGVSSGVYAKYGLLLREQLARDLPTLQVILRPSEGSVANIERLVTGTVDFAIATVDSLVAYEADGGEGAGRLCACARLYDDYMQLVVLASSPVQGTTDLAGLRVGVGQEQSGVRLVTRELLAAAGLDMERDITAVPAGIDTMPEMLESGQLDAFFWSGGVPTSALTQLSERNEVRLVPLGDLLPTLAGQGPHTAFYRAAVMPPDLYEDMGSERVTDTVAVANLLVTTESADRNLTEALTRSVINGRDRIGRQVHAAQRVDVRTAIYTQPLRLHPGARDYYRSVKS